MKFPRNAANTGFTRSLRCERSVGSSTSLEPGEDGLGEQ